MLCVARVLVLDDDSLLVPHLRSLEAPQLANL